MSLSNALNWGIAVALVAGMSSCSETGANFASGDMLLSPAMAPAGFGNSATRPKFHEMHVVAATKEQRALAEARAKKALKGSVVAEKVRKERVKYVAVPVTRTKAQVGRGTPVMKVNVTTGLSTGEVFTPQQGAPKDGEKIQLGGDSTLYFATSGDKL